MRRLIALLVVVAVLAGIGLRVRAEYLDRQREKAEQAEVERRAKELNDRYYAGAFVLQRANVAIIYNAGEQAQKQIGHSELPAAAGCESRSVAFQAAVRELLGDDYQVLHARANGYDAGFSLYGIKNRDALEDALRKLIAHETEATAVNEALVSYCKARKFEVVTEIPKRWSNIQY